MHGRIMQLKLDEITNIIKSYNLDTMFFITYAFQVKGQYIPEDDVIILNPQFTKKE